MKTQVLGLLPLLGETSLEFPNPDISLAQTFMRLQVSWGVSQVDEMEDLCLSLSLLLLQASKQLKKKVVKNK